MSGGRLENDYLSRQSVLLSKAASGVVLGETLRTRHLTNLGSVSGLRHRRCSQSSLLPGLCQRVHRLQALYLDISHGTSTHFIMRPYLYGTSTGTKPRSDCRSHTSSKLARDQRRLHRSQVIAIRRTRKRF